MSHATITYDLADPDDSRELRYALAGRDALICLERIEQAIRGSLKHGEPSAETQAILKEVRSLIPYELTNLLE